MQEEKVKELKSIIEELLAYCGGSRPSNPGCQCAPCRARRILDEVI